MMKKRSVDMLEGNLLLNILLFAIPVVISGILQLLFNAIDVIIVGKFSGSASMAAVSSTGSLISLVTNLFIGLSVGSSVTIAKRIGSQDYEEVNKAVQTSICMAIIFGVALTIFGMVFSRQFMIWMRSPEDVIDLSTTYLRYYFSGTLATMIYNFASAILRAKGDTRRPLMALIVAGVLNALMNLFFVISLKMDVAGVGLASSLSSYVSAIMVLMVLIKDESYTHVDMKHLYLEKSAAIDIMVVGVPAGIQSTFFNISNVMVQSSVNEFGQIIMAGNGAASSIGNFVYNIMNSFYQCCLTFTSQNVGAGKINRVPKILVSCLILVTIFGLISGYGSYLFGETLLNIYADDPKVIEAGMIRLALIVRFYFLCGIMEVFVGSLRGMGSSILPMFVSLMGACVFRIVWIMTWFKAHHTISDLYISYPLSWIITASVHFITFLFVYHRLKKKTAHS